MKQGVSPVVAIVLLIAIAVISAVAVWTWVGPLTSKPPMGSTTQYALQVIKCYPGTSPTTIDIKNSGGVTINTQSFSLISKTDGSMQNTSVLTTTLAPGQINSSLAIWPALLSGSSYALRATNFPDIEFTC